MKKLVSMFTVCCFMMSMVYQPALAKSEEVNLEYSERVVNTYSFSAQEEDTPAAISDEAETVLLHHNGEEIETDIFKDGQSEGNYVLASLKSCEYGQPSETVFFANRSEVTKGELDEMVAESLEEPAESSFIRKYNWSFYYGTTITSKVSSVVTLTKQAGNVKYNGKKSVWNIFSLLGTICE